MFNLPFPLRWVQGFITSLVRRYRLESNNFSTFFIVPSSLEEHFENMGAGSSTSKSRVLTKVQVVAALTAKSNERKDEQKANEQEWKQADKFVTK